MNWSGAQGRNRTTDTAIFSRMLYQLSYLGVQLLADDGCERDGCIVCLRRVVY